MAHICTAHISIHLDQVQCRCMLFRSPKHGLTSRFNRSSDSTRAVTGNSRIRTLLSLVRQAESRGTYNGFLPISRLGRGQEGGWCWLSERPLCAQMPTGTMRTIKAGWVMNANKKPKAGQPGHTGLSDGARLWTQVCLAPKFSKILSFMTQITKCDELCQSTNGQGFLL